MNKCGFTLLEVVVATLMLAVAVGGFLCSFLMGKDAAGRAGRFVAGMDLARDTLEELKWRVSGADWPEGDLSAAGNPHNAEAFLDMSGHRLGFDFGGSREYTVVNIDADNAFDTDGNGNAADDIDYKSVTVTVDWNEP